MGKQCLDISQMKHLKELGVDTRTASLCWVCLNSEPYISFYDKEYPQEDTKVIPAFTLQDILDLLPIYIDFEYSRHELRIKRMIFDGDKVMHSVIYEAQDYTNWYVMQSYEELIDAAYEMLCWVIENGYLKVKQDEGI